MGQKIIVFGDMPQGDAELVGAMAGRWGLELSLVSPDSDPALLFGGGYPAGVISYLPCTGEAMGYIFGSRSAGFGEHVPFFQRVDGGVPAFLYELPLSGVFASPLNEAAAMNILLAVGRNSDLQERHDALMRQLIAHQEQKDRLAAIGVVLCSENDFMALLQGILTAGCDAVRADAGCVYTRDRMVDDTLCDTLHLRLCRSGPFESGDGGDVKVKITPETMAGCAAYTGQFVEVADIDRIRPDAPFRNDKGFIGNPEYTCKSVLTMPLKNIEDEVVGVLQLINKKPEKGMVLADAEDVRQEALPFTSDDIDVLRVLARYAAVSLERISLYR